MFIADLHIHSAYSRATSKDLTPIALEAAARRKGIQLLATGDFTHPAYRDILKQVLTPLDNGLFALKQELQLPQNGALAMAEQTRFIISGEISSIYKKNGRTRKVHNVILLPTMDAAEKISAKLESIGCNLHADGRPIIGLDSKNLLELTLECCPEAIFIPAHIWTPHFSLFGSYSGFDSIEECFEDMTPYIHAVETGLSSDPPMNWRLSALDKYALVSNSDAHSTAKLAREANIFTCELSYPALRKALFQPQDNGFWGTIEFFPEEGKYHYDGHRNCHVCLSPEESSALQRICPVCGKPITIGVANRVAQLADRPLGFRPEQARPFQSLVPLPEVIADCLGVASSNSVKVKREYEKMLHTLGPELKILRNLPLSDIDKAAGSCIAEAIRRIRVGEVNPVPGYDGEYGRIEVIDQATIDRLQGQDSLFGNLPIQPLNVPPSFTLPSTMAEQKQAEQPRTQDAEVYEYGLNAEQWQAATASESYIAVIAGPGTGKTKTLVSRIASLIEHRGANPSNIVAVTFTNKAATEMRERLTAHFSERNIVKQLRIGTFHNLCLQLLQEQKQQATIISNEDALHLAADTIEELKLSISPAKLLTEVSHYKSTPQQNLAADFQEAFLLYNQKLHDFEAWDFDDILLQALALQTPPKAAIKHLLVDEFQDGNILQHRLIRKWSGSCESLFVIGDPDQSIYGFRGASANCFSQLREEYPQLREISLHKNYRSAPAILQAALPVIQGKTGQSRILEAQRTAEEKVQLRHEDAGFHEALFVVKEIDTLVGGIDMLQAHNNKRKKAASSHSYGFNDIAVLYRTRRQAEIIEQCLQKEGIPYVTSGREDYLSDATVLDTLAFFRFILSPSDIFSLRRCMLFCDVSAPTAQKIFHDYAQGKRNLAALDKICASHAETESFRQLLSYYIGRCRKEKPVKLLDSWIERHFLDENPAMEKLRNTALLYPDMNMLQRAVLLGEEADIVRNGSRSYQTDAVRLMTIHASKGLEFPVVFLCGLKDGLLPLKNTYTQIDLCEERRLMFVAMTRAAEQLYLLTAEPESPFIVDIPVDTIERQVQHKPRIQGKQLSLFN